MSRMKKSKILPKANTIKTFKNNFLIIDEITKLKSINSEIELCIIKTDFDNNDIKFIKNLKKKYNNVTFWIATINISRENIIIANKIGIKTVISSPVKTKTVEEFFNKKYKIFENKESIKDFDIKYIENSKIMIVDDNLSNVELLEEILSPFNIKIHSFSKPKEARKIAVTEKFDLILLDVMMPEMSGFELAHKMKISTINKNTPIVFISALSDSYTKIKGYNAGSFAYIEKPFDINIVKAQIFNILKKQKDIISQTAAKETFLATVAHDLKTPINAEINALTLLLNNNLGEIEESQKEILRDILASSRFMQDLVENILCKNKIENSNFNLSKQVYSLKELVEHCIVLTKYILDEKNQYIEFECNAVHTLLPLDFVEIKRAINNLIDRKSEYSNLNSKIVINIFETIKITDDKSNNLTH